MGLSVRNISKSVGGAVVLDGVSFDVADGEFVGLLGPSGCGTTMTLRCIAGLEEPDRGTIEIGGRTVTDAAQQVMLPPDERNVGMVFQSYEIWPHLTAYENVAFPLRRQKIAKGAISEKVEGALDLVGMRGFADRSATELSGGQQQRIALARAIVQERKVLLFDEPLSNLDIKLRKQVRAELRALQRQLGITAVYGTHDQAEALSLADRIVVMDAGRLVQTAEPAELCDRPASAFVAEFVATANFLDVRVETEDGVTIAWVSDGSSFEVPSGRVTLGRCRVMVRPEDVEIAPADQYAIAEPGWIFFRGRLSRQSDRGTHYDYTVEVEGTSSFRVHSRVKITDPDVLLRFRREDCTIVDPPAS